MAEPQALSNERTESDDDDFTRKSDAFMLWFRSQPGASVHPDVSIADYRARNASRGVKAVSNIAADTDLFTIPRSSILSIETSQLPQRLPSIFSTPQRTQSNAHDSSPSNAPHAADTENIKTVPRRSWTALILTLIYEFLQPAHASKWKPYFDVLPRTFETLMFWSADELARLHGCAVLRKIGKDAAEREFRNTLVPILRTHEDVFFGGAEKAAGWADEHLVALAHVMGSTIMAYAFDVEEDDDDEENDSGARDGGAEDGFVTDDDEEGEEPPFLKAMVPFADMLNADVPPNASLFHGKDSFSMKALRDIAAGEEILNDYGQLPRSDLLRRYGYVTNNYAVFDCVEIGLDAVVHAVQECRSEVLPDDDIEERIGYLEDKDVVEDGSFEIVWRDQSLNGGLFPSTMLRTVCTLLAEKDEYKRAAKSPDEDALFRSDVRDVLAKITEARLSEYSAGSDEAGAIASQQNRRHRMADEVRRGEIALLREAVESLSTDSILPQAKRRRFQ